LLFLFGRPKLPAAAGQEESFSTAGAALLAPAARSGAFSLWKNRRLWRETSEFGGKPHSSAALIDPPTPLQQYQSGLAKQQLLSDLQRTTAHAAASSRWQGQHAATSAEGHLHPEGAVTAQRHWRITHEQAGADWPQWTVDTCTRAPHRVSLEGAVADQLVVALYWRGRLSSARMEPITTSKQLLLLEAIDRVRNDVNAQHFSFGSAMCLRLINMP
jgi:hypothetical protein